MRTGTKRATGCISLALLCCRLLQSAPQKNFRASMPRCVDTVHVCAAGRATWPKRYQRVVHGGLRPRPLLVHLVCTGPPTVRAGSAHTTQTQSRKQPLKPPDCLHGLCRGDVPRYVRPMGEEEGVKAAHAQTLAQGTAVSGSQRMHLPGQAQPRMYSAT